MADRTIDQLPSLPNGVQDNSLIPVSQGGQASKMTGLQFRQWAQSGVAQYVEQAEAAADIAGLRADDSDSSATAAAASATAAQSASQKIEDMGVTFTILPDGSVPTVSKTVSPQGVVTLNFGIARGPKGDTGSKGDTGDRGPEGPQGAVGSAAEILPASGLFRFSIGASPTTSEPGHLLLTYSGDETNPEAWYIDFDSDPDAPNSTYGHLFYDPDIDT